jgi:ketosteroid isomerase-like protein
VSQNVETVRRSIEGWNRGDFDAWTQNSHPAVEFVSAVRRAAEGDSTPVRGLAEMRQFWDEWHGLWDVRIELEAVQDLGDTVVALGDIDTRGRTSGVQMEFPIAYVFEFDEGSFRRVSAYLSHAEALAAVGLSP